MSSSHFSSSDCGEIDQISFMVVYETLKSRKLENHNPRNSRKQSRNMMLIEKP